ncbi:hypothetical protein MXB_360, partial [Myxobolus squamalis]
MVSRQKRKAADTQKSLTYEEKSQLSEIDILYNTNLFKLQTEEFLNSNIVDTLNFQESIQKVKNIILSAPPIKAVPLESIVTSFKNGSVLLPIPTFQFNEKQIFECSQICMIETDGSFSKNLWIAHSNVDISFELPIKVTKNDIKTRHYFLKRALILCNIACNFSRSEYELRFTTQSSNQWMPNINLKEMSTGRTFTIRPFVKDIGFLNISQFLPHKRNIKLPKCFNESSRFIETPYLNNFILRECRAFIDIDSASLEPYKDALILLKCWMKCRPFGNGVGALTGYMICVILSCLVLNKTIHPYMSPYQIIRIIFNFVASNSLSKKSVSLYLGSDREEKIKLFRAYFPVVLLDQSGAFNFLFELSKNNYDW